MSIENPMNEVDHPAHHLDQPDLFDDNLRAIYMDDGTEGSDLAQVGQLQIPPDGMPVELYIDGPFGWTYVYKLGRRYK